VPVRILSSKKVLNGFSMTFEVYRKPSRYHHPELVSVSILSITKSMKY